MRRRAVLSTIATAGSILSAGCLLGSPDPRLGAVVVVNHDDRPKNLQVRVERDNDVVASGGVRVPASKPGETTRAVAIAPDAVTEPGRYDVRARLADESMWTEAQYGHRTDDCFSVYAAVDETDQITLGVQSNDEYCAETGTSGS